MKKEYIKRKLIIMGISILVLFLIFMGNVINRLGDKNSDDTKEEEPIIVRNGDMITTKESVRLLKSLGIPEDELTNIIKIKQKEITETDTDTDANNEKKEITDTDSTEISTDYLVFKDCTEIINLVSRKMNLDINALMQVIGIDFLAEPKNKAVLITEFLHIYEAILASLPEDAKPVTEKSVFILGSPNPLTNIPNKQYTMVTDQGNYTYFDATSYADLYIDGHVNMEMYKEDDTLTKKEDSKNQEKSYTYNDFSFYLSDYIDGKITAYVRGTELIYIKGVSEEETVLYNVWVTSGKDSTISTFLHDVSRDFTTKYKLPGEIKGKICDITIQDKKIVKMSLKPDIIGGKVLVANQNYIELEKYGKVNLDENYKIYKIYGELSMEVTNSILVGYETTDFVVANGKIVAALIKDKIKAKNIRTLIKTNNFNDIFHSEVKLTADREFTVTAGNEKKTYQPGEELTFLPDDKLFDQGRIHINTNSENGKIQLLSLQRADGKPNYRGTMELAIYEEGIVIINDLPIEEYLYAVLPSEMPSSYGAEALKVQAICARSYAYNQLFSNSYRQYGAHVDDSVAFQVYNNIAENDASILAVKDTYGKVIKYKDSVISAYYFSTSSGHTASISEVWGATNEAEYLVGKLQSLYDFVDGEAVYTSTQTGEPLNLDFTSDNVFRDFILNPNEVTYDSSFPWYRWSVSMSLDNITSTVNGNLLKRYQANPALIQTLVSGDVRGTAVYESKPIETIGDVKDILVGKREKSGILSEIILVGSKATIKVSSEYIIRSLLAPMNDVVVRQDDTTTSGLSLLPSAFFVMDKEGKSITFHGGGYGHGVGVSQNGAKAMADSGKTYETIIKHYYNGVDLGFIYE